MTITSRFAGRFEIHPCAAAWPDISKEEQEELTKSIQEKGLINGLTLLKTDSGQYHVIDGRQRLRSLLELDWKTREIVAVSTLVPKKWTQSEIAEYVMALNQNRRHLTPGERADAVVATLKAAGKRPRKQGEKSVSDDTHYGRQEVAQAALVGESTAQRAIDKSEGRLKQEREERLEKERGAREERKQRAARYPRQQMNEIETSNEEAEERGNAAEAKEKERVKDAFSAENEEKWKPLAGKTEKKIHDALAELNKHGIHLTKDNKYAKLHDYILTLQHENKLLKDEQKKLQADLSNTWGLVAYWKAYHGVATEEEGL